MGFPSLSCGIIMPKPLADLAELWIHLRFMVRLALFYLGLFDPTDVGINWDEHGVPLSAAHLHSPVPTLTLEEVKRRLPVVEFGNFAACSGGDAEFDGDEGPVCAVCLCGLEPEHKIRKLCNCSHVFHLECLDKWVDQGQMTCPLCRSGLLPRETKKKDQREFWVVERVSHLFGEGLSVW